MLTLPFYGALCGGLHSALIVDLCLLVLTPCFLTPSSLRSYRPNAPPYITIIIIIKIITIYRIRRGPARKMALKCSMNGSPKKKNNKNKKKSKKIIKIKNYERVVANTRLRRVNCSDVLGFELFLGFCNFPEFGAPIVTWFIQGWLWCEKKKFLRKLYLRWPTFPKTCVFRNFTFLSSHFQ